MHSNLPILLVEDEPDGQELLSRILAVADVPVVVAGNGEIAWQQLTLRPFAASVIDLALPGMDGITLLHHIRSDATLHSLPCIAITAYHTPELKREALNQGFDAYFPKPLDRIAFMSALEDIIGG